MRKIPGIETFRICLQDDTDNSISRFYQLQQSKWQRRRWISDLSELEVQQKFFNNFSLLDYVLGLFVLSSWNCSPRRGIVSDCALPWLVSPLALQRQTRRRIHCDCVFSFCNVSLSVCRRPLTNSSLLASINNGTTSWAPSSVEDHNALCTVGRLCAGCVCLNIINKRVGETGYVLSVAVMFGR